MTMRTILATLTMGLALGLVACSDKDDTGDDDSGTSLTGACELYASIDACPECADGEVTCSYGDVSVTEMSCGGCQAEVALYKELCDSGNTDSVAEIEAGMECDTPPKSPACVLADEWAGCDDCADGDVTCTYGEYSATEMSCGDCQARGQLYAMLCEADVADERSAIESGTECSDPV